MTERSFIRELDRARKKEPFPFWGFSLAILTILRGEFIVRVDGYLLNNIEPYFGRLPEDIIGWLMIVAGILKIFGVLSKNNKMKKWGIWALSAMWTGLFVLAFTFSFGSGYPDPSWINALFLMAACYRISLKGDFA